MLKRLKILNIIKSGWNLKIIKNNIKKSEKLSFSLFFIKKSRKNWKCQKNVLSLWCKTNEDDILTENIKR